MPKEKGRTPPPSPEPYELAARYPDDQTSYTPYREAQEVLRDDPSLPMSVFPLKVRRIDEERFDWNVVIVGPRPPVEVDEEFRRILSDGELTTLPDEVSEQLWRRRARNAQLGSWVEGHYKEGRRLSLIAPAWRRFFPLALCALQAAVHVAAHDLHPHIS